MSELFIAFVVFATVVAYTTKRRQCEHCTTELPTSSRQDDVDDMRIEHELHMDVIEMCASIEASHAEVEALQRACDSEARAMNDNMKHMREMDEYCRGLR